MWWRFESIFIVCIYLFVNPIQTQICDIKSHKLNSGADYTLTHHVVETPLNRV